MNFFSDKTQKPLLAFLLLSAFTAISHSSHFFLPIYDGIALKARSPTEESQNPIDGSRDADLDFSMDESVMAIYSSSIRFIKEGDHYRVIIPVDSDDSTSMTMSDAAKFPPQQ